MSFQEFASFMWPYWFLGVFMIFAVYASSHRDLLKIDRPSVIKWLKLLCKLSAVRLVFWMTPWGSSGLHASFANMSQLPLASTLFVFWEDMVHTVPLVLLARYMPDTRWSKLLQFIPLSLVMLYFGAAHIYQGFWVALIMTLYVPLTMKIAKEKGFGTLMICHILYDIVTLSMISLSVRFM